MDEFPEFDRRSIDTLRQPLEDKVVSISRVHGQATFPADFTLVAAMNPHRGTHDGSDPSDSMLDAYKKKISGPIMDRIDLWLTVSHIPYEELAQNEKHIDQNRDETKRAREQVQDARLKQRQRYGVATKTNGVLSARDIEIHVRLAKETETLLIESAKKLALSPRGYHRLIKVARTIADLEGADDIKTTHVLEALQYRARI